MSEPSTTWDDYVAALDELDQVRRTAATAVASQERAGHAARNELAGVRKRIALQRARLVDAGNRAGRSMPGLEPQPPDRASASAQLPASVMDPTPGVSAALAGAWATLDAADTSLTIAAESPSGAGLLADWPTPARNALPYGWYALVAVIALVVINAFASSPSARVFALGLDLLVPAAAFLLGAVSIGLLYGRDQHGRKPRSVPLGLLICAVPVVIGIGLSIF